MEALYAIPVGARARWIASSVGKQVGSMEANAGCATVPEKRCALPAMVRGVREPTAHCAAAKENSTVLPVTGPVNTSLNV